MIKSSLLLTLFLLVGCQATPQRPLEPPRTNPVQPPEIPQIPRQKPSETASDCGPFPVRPRFSEFTPENQPQVIARYMALWYKWGEECKEKNRFLMEWIATN